MINGHLNSFVQRRRDHAKADDGYWKVPVDARVVQALVAGLGDGLAIMDGSSTHTINAFIYSRERPRARSRTCWSRSEAAGQAKPAAPQIARGRAGPSARHARGRRRGDQGQDAAKDTFGFL